MLCGMNIRKSLPLLASLLLPAAALATGPPCQPCAGVRVADPAAAVAAIAADPQLEGEERLYVAWSAELDGTADPAAFSSIRNAGGTPWISVSFRAPAPVLEHVDALERELEDLARIARGAGDRAHFQIAWEPAAGDAGARDLAFVIKRAAVAVTGARAGARVLVGPLASDVGLLRALYAEDVAAYVDGLALSPAPRAEIEAMVAAFRELDPGKGVALDALPWPEPASRALSRTAEWNVAGVAVTFFERPRPTAEDLVPLKLLAREFQGDLSFDPATVPTGADAAWTYVRGEDLGLRVIAATTPGQGAMLFFADPQLKAPTLIDPETGEESTPFGQQRTARGLLVPVDEPGAAVLLRLERMTAAELAGLEERLLVEDERQMPVEEVLRRLQAFEDDQARRLDHYQARSILHLRFSSGGANVQAAYEGPFFYRRDQGFDWVWDTFYVDGVKWKGKHLPEIPLIQPEKAAALPIEILFTKEYDYRLRGTGTVDGRDCWLVDFRPREEPAPGHTLYQGTVWIDREIYARVRTRAVQLGLEGDVISNEETSTFTPIGRDGRPVPWSSHPETEIFVLPTRVVGQQILSVLNAAVPVELTTEVSEIRINGDDFEAALETAWASEATMVRDTEQGMRYLRKDEEGNRFVEQKVDTDRLFIVGGVFWDESVDYPIPLAGVNYLALDHKGTGNQVNVFFAGPLVTVNYAEPRLFGSKWDAGVNLFGFFIDRGDEIFRDGAEVPAEEIESKVASAALFVGRPLGNFVKLDFTYRARWEGYSRADDTAAEFVLPSDTLTHALVSELRYQRGGYRLALQGSFNERGDWDFWGLPGNPDFDPEQKDYVRWQARFSKTFWFKNFRQLGLALEHLDGSDLDRFSRYDFGIFGDASVAGYQSGLVRADEADGLHLSYGVNAANVVRFELEGDAVWATSEATGLDGELLAGFGLEGSLALPWNMLTNFEVGYALAGPGEGGVAARIVFLKLFPEGWRLWGRKKKKEE